MRPIDSARALRDAVKEWGFLPFFKNAVPGFSVEEQTPSGYWFAEGQDGPWEWKGPAARSGECLYGKIFRGGAGFVSREFIPDFINFRRDGYDFDARFEESRASRKDAGIYEAIVKHGSLTTPELKKLCGYGKNGLKGFDTVITRLQMQGYVSVLDFDYAVDKAGRSYGWGISRYSTPEAQLGENFVRSRYVDDPQECGQRLLRHLITLFPNAPSGELERLLKA